MEIEFFERVREGLEEKRDLLRSWLQTTPVEVRHSRLGNGDTLGVESYIQKIDQSIESADDGTLGLCVVCHEHVEPELLEVDYTSCVCLDHLSTLERRDLEHELELAQSVQRTLLPQEAPTVPGLEFAAFSRPAQYVGGDFFDFYELQTDHFGMTIADVAGHGMSASLHMASVQTLLRALMPSGSSPAEVVGRIQNLFRHNIRFNTFVTLFLAVYDRKTRVLSYCNAGHNPALVWRSNGQARGGVEWLKPTGPAIGLLEDPDFKNSRASLLPGDILLLYTDGITEARNRQEIEFGNERLADLVRDNRSLGPKELVREIRSSLDSFVEGQAYLDDITLVVCKATG